jgi:hypothetical protein
MKAITMEDPEYLGYRHPEYALSLAEYGRPHALDNAGGWVLERQIPNTRHRDSMGLYPLFHCRDWQALPQDIQHLRDAGTVSLVLVTDPMLGEDERKLFRQFDVAEPFKTHYLSSLHQPPAQTVSRHHRYHARKAAKELEVDVPEAPLAYLDEWCAIYEALVRRHGVKDLRAFSRDGFRRLLSMPGVILFRAIRHGRCVGAQIILIQGDVAFAHLAAFNDEGYRHGASYLLDWAAMEHLRGRVGRLNWGGGSGLECADESGLARYKQGWATERRTSYLLGVVLDRGAYERLAMDTGNATSTYFPRYRAGEFADAIQDLKG